MDWFVAVLLLNYVPARAHAGMQQTDVTKPLFDRALPPGLPRPDVAFREPGIGQSYFQFYAGDGLMTTPFVAHLYHVGLPFQSWSILQLGRTGPRLDVGTYREGLRVTLPRWVPTLLSPGHGAFFLPLRATPIEVALNTLFYAALITLVMEGSTALRRRRRSLRSLCARCKYPIRDLATCPECGALVPIAHAQTPT
jgi:hypothetical protein